MGVGSSKEGRAGSGEESQLNPTERELENFFEQVKNVNDQISMLAVLVTKIQDANEESKAVIKDVEIKHAIEGCINMAEEVARVAVAALRDLEKNNASNRKKIGCEEGSVIDRARTSATQGIKEKLDKMLSCFETLKDDIRKERRESVKREYYLVTGHEVDEKTVDQIIVSGEEEHIIRKAIQEGYRHVPPISTDAADQPLLLNYPAKRPDVGCSQDQWQEEKWKVDQLKNFADDFKLEVPHPRYHQKWVWMMVTLIIVITIVVIIIIIIIVKTIRAR